MESCEHNRGDYLIGLARNGRLVDQIEAELAEAAIESAATGAPAWRFKDFLWTTLDSWSRRPRVVGKAQHTRDEANPRFVVTSLGRQRAAARTLYEDLYCARGEIENRQGIEPPPPARLGARLRRAHRTALIRTRQRTGDITITNSASARTTELVQSTPYTLQVPRITGNDAPSSIAIHATIREISRLELSICAY